MYNGFATQRNRELKKFSFWGVSEFWDTSRWYLLVLPSETHAYANMTSLRAIDGDTSYTSHESFSMSNSFLPSMLDSKPKACIPVNIFVRWVLRKVISRSRHWTKILAYILYIHWLLKLVVPKGQLSLACFQLPTSFKVLRIVRTSQFRRVNFK